MATAEVTVVGGGIFGLSIAWECARRGAQVRLIERGRIGCGASGGLLGALAPHVPENWNEKKQFQLESLLMAEAFWAEVRAVSGVDPGYARSGRLQPLADDRAVAQALARTAGAARHWGGHADWRVERADGAQDWTLPAPTGLWLRDTLSARLHPRQAAAALAAAIRAVGGSVEEGVLPEAGPILPGQEPPAGIFANERSAGPVIWATGVQGLADLSAAVGRSVGRGEKGQAALFACAAGARPQLFVDALHIVPHGDGTVAVGSTSERQFDHAATTDGQLEDLIARARAICPALAAAPVIDRWAGLRPRAASRAPMLGAWPGRAGHYLANGGFKIGFGMAPKVAEVIADLVLEGRDAIPAGFGVEDSF